MVQAVSRVELGGLDEGGGLAGLFFVLFFCFSHEKVSYLITAT